MADTGSPCNKAALLMDTTKDTPCTCLSTITPFKFLHLAHQFGLPSPDILQRISLVVVRYDGRVWVGVTFQNKAILSTLVYQFLPPHRVSTFFVLPVHTAQTVLTSVVLTLKYNINP